MRESFLPFSMPTIGEEEIAEVTDTLRMGWLTTGPKTKTFEEQFREYVGATNAIAVNSCTAGLHIALTALGIGPGDDVIIPTLTFCSTANVVVHLGARPVLVDVGEDFNVTPAAIEAAVSPRTKAIVVVHFGGQACDLNSVYEIAGRHRLPVIEDAAHAVGSAYRGLRIGADHMGSAQDARVVVFSFYATKNMTTGEGGMITTSESSLADHMRLLALHGMSKDAWKRYTGAGSWYYEVVSPGYKDNMTDIQASLGMHQLRKLEAFIAERQKLARCYRDRLQGIPEIVLPIVHPDRNHAYHLFVIQLDLDRLTIDRAQFIQHLHEMQIGASVHFIPVHLHPFYSKHFGYKCGQLPVAENLYGRIVSLPLYPKMTESDVGDVVAAVDTIVSTHRK